VDQLVSNFLKELDNLARPWGASVTEDSSSAPAAEPGPEPRGVQSEEFPNAADDGVLPIESDAVAEDLDRQLARVLEDLEREQAKVIPLPIKETARAEAVRPNLPEIAVPIAPAPDLRPKARTEASTETRALLPRKTNATREEVGPAVAVEEEPIYARRMQPRLRAGRLRNLNWALACVALLVGIALIWRFWFSQPAAVELRKVELPPAATAPSAVDTAASSADPLAPSEGSDRNSTSSAQSAADDQLPNPAGRPAATQARSRTQRPMPAAEPEPGVAPSQRNGGTSVQSPSSSRVPPASAQTKSAEANRLASDSSGRLPANQTTSDQTARAVANPAPTPPSVLPSSPANPANTDAANTAVSSPVASTAPPTISNMNPPPAADRPASNPSPVPSTIPSVSAGAVDPARGGGLSPVRATPIPAVAVAKIVPKYPVLARNMRIGGKIEVDADVDEQGRVTRAQAVSGPLQLRFAAETALKQWRFTPAKLNGTNVKSTVRIDVVFNPE